MSRVATYLRVSVTDRCDLRCLYCHCPGECGLRGLHSLTRAEVVRFVRAACACGVKKVRLTGGEPLLDEDIVGIVRGISRVRGLQFLGLTTNGQRLGELARPLRRAGLQSVNISLPSLEGGVYRKITGGELANVLAGLEAALSEGFAPVKLNVVVLRGINDGEVKALASLARMRPIEVRFIECMPFARGAHERDLFVPARDVFCQLRSLGRLSLVPNSDSAGSARKYAVSGFQGFVALIAPMTRPFCRACSRLRLTSDGKLRACLVDGGEVDARQALVPWGGAEPVRELIGKAMALKPQRHSSYFCGAMARIGG